MSKSDNKVVNGVLIGALIGLIVSMGIIFYVIFAKSATLKCTAAAARKILRASVDLEEKRLDYDLNKDGVITAEDARIALRRAVGLADLTELVEPTTELVETTTEKEYYQVGVLSTCGLTESQLANGLYYNLKQYAWAFLEAEKEYNINAVFLSAVAALESGWGRSTLAINKNNFFGWRGSNGWASFNSPYDGIMHVAKTLRKNYLTPGGSCFNGYEVEDIAICYCPGGGWAGQIRNIMAMIKNNAV